MEHLNKFFWAFVALLIISIIALSLNGAYSTKNVGKDCRPTDEHQFFYRSKAPPTKYTKYLCISEEWRASHE